MTGEKRIKPEVYYNKHSKIIEIDGIQIPINEVKLTYLVESKSLHFVRIKCIYSDCIISLRYGEIDNSLYRFKTKERCYDFMNLLSNAPQ